MDIITIKESSSGKKQQIAIDLNPEEKHQKEKKGFKKRIKSFLRRFDPRPDFTFKEGE
jgi:hypothetical protein